MKQKIFKWQIVRKKFSHMNNRNTKMYYKIINCSQRPIRSIRKTFKIYKHNQMAPKAFHKSIFLKVIYKCINNSYNLHNNLNLIIITKTVYKNNSYKSKKLLCNKFRILSKTMKHLFIMKKINKRIYRHKTYKKIIFYKKFVQFNSQRQSK